MRGVLRATSNFASVFLPTARIGRMGVMRISRSFLAFLVISPLPLVGACSWWRMTSPSYDDSDMFASDIPDSAPIRKVELLTNWRGERGSLITSPHDDIVVGAYDYHSGKLRLRFQDGMLTGYWAEKTPDGDETVGEVEFRPYRENGVLRMNGRFRQSLGDPWDEGWDIYQTLQGPTHEMHRAIKTNGGFDFVPWAEMPVGNRYIPVLALNSDRQPEQDEVDRYHRLREEAGLLPPRERPQVSKNTRLGATPAQAIQYSAPVIDRCFPDHQMSSSKAVLDLTDRDFAAGMVEFEFSDESHVDYEFVLALERDYSGNRHRLVVVGNELPGEAMRGCSFSLGWQLIVPPKAVDANSGNLTSRTPEEKRERLIRATAKCGLVYLAENECTKEIEGVLGKPLGAMTCSEFIQDVLGEKVDYGEQIVGNLADVAIESDDDFLQFIGGITKLGLFAKCVSDNQ